MSNDTPPPYQCQQPQPRSQVQRVAWVAAGGLCLALGVIGLALPLMPSVPFVLLAAFCFSRGSERCERWMLDHPRLGPPIRAWRANRAVPLRVKQFATAMMAISSGGAWWLLPEPWRWVPGACCLAVTLWMWQLPHAAQEEAHP